MFDHPHKKKKKPGTGNSHANNSKAILIQITYDTLVQALEEMQNE